MSQPERAAASLSPDDPFYAPGLKRRKRAKRDALYWMASPQAVAKGYQPAILTIPANASEFEAALFCRERWAELEGWRAGIETGPSKFSVGWLVDRYLKDEFSPYQRLRFNSQRNYAQDCAIIKIEKGTRRIDPNSGNPRIIGEDIYRWHRAWGLPGADGIATAPSRARHLVTMFRILVKYAVVIGAPGAIELAAVLSNMEFPTTPARTVAPTREQVLAIVGKALEMGYRSIAIATLAQFEFTERRISIIGRWEKDQWRPGWTWQAISSDWVIRYAQTKVGVVAREYALCDTPFLLELIQRTPEESRIGPIIVCEKSGKPWREKHYTDTWREIARAAKVPDEICSMDMRAGAATEIDALPGITERDIKNAGGWSSSVFNRYTREPQRRAQNVVKLRQQANEK